MSYGQMKPKYNFLVKNSTCRVWRRKNAELHPKNTIPTVTRTTDLCKGKNEWGHVL